MDRMQALATDPRAQRGLRIYRRGGIKQLSPFLFLVPSESGRRPYKVDISAPGWSCECPDAPNVARCKHSWSVELHIVRFVLPDGTVVEARVTVARDWPVVHRSYENEKPNVRRMLGSLCDLIPVWQRPAGRPGRDPAPLRDVVPGLFWKVWNGDSQRRSMDDIDSLRRCGVTADTFDTNTYYKYMVDPAMMPLLESLVQISARPFSALETGFASDATGISCHQWDRWFEEKWGSEAQKAAEEERGDRAETREERTARRKRNRMRKKEWVKLHLTCGLESQIVTAVSVTRGNAADSPQFIKLLDDTVTTFRVDRMLLDKAYLSKNNVLAIAAVGGVPFIPPKIDSSPRGTHLYNRLIRWAQANTEAFDAEYKHDKGRVQVESCIAAIKAKYGPYVRSRDPVAQVNECLLKVLAHNLSRVSAFMERQLVKPDFWTVQAPPDRSVSPLRLVDDEKARASHPLLGNDNACRPDGDVDPE